MVSDQHFDIALNAIDRINENNVPGDIVECGVWKGGMSMAMVLKNQQYNIGRHFWLYDTFEGLPAPDSEKDDPKAKKWYDEIQKAAADDGQKGAELTKREQDHKMEEGKWNLGPLDVVKHNMYYTGYPKDHFHFVKGKVEDTLITGPLPEKIAVMRLDTDWYESTKAEFDVLWERVSPGGVVIVDDYFNWEGARTATDEFFAEVLKVDIEPIVQKNKHGFQYWKPY